MIHAHKKHTTILKRFIETLFYPLCNICHPIQASEDILADMLILNDITGLSSAFIRFPDGGT
jgi:hypothetical protein